MTVSEQRRVVVEAGWDAAMVQQLLEGQEQMGLATETSSVRDVVAG